MLSKPNITIRPATPADLGEIVALIRDLAAYEKLLHECSINTEDLAAAMFGVKPCAEALMGELNEVVQGVALFFTNFSTFKCKPGIYLEDLYVRPAARGAGLGKALLIHLAKLAVARGCARFEWSVLDWNAPAIGFYQKLGAVPMDGWTIMRVSGDSLEALAAL